ncbi:glycoside hydrolase family 19 protein [Roseateles cellulosilyticus]|uniref:Lytic enzyme n=1 Tax=Pelomonas cellulosilytica TaxID=2906762 RepID=A0ABS8XUY2_9BURK|nr:lytic enzyme [Pelomonas sp. P8]MCE4554626.1 lytic enzyme [Pelomonas sp. P8]
MPIVLSLPLLTQLAPNARSSYREAAATAQPVLDRHGITENKLRLAHFLAQVLHESGALTVQVENLNYSAPRLTVVWPKRFQPLGPLDPAQFANNPERLANEVYGGRMGNTQPGDGFRYRGRGLLQLTGRDSYQEATRIVRSFTPDAPDFEADPDLCFGAAWAVPIAAAEWESKGCNALADADQITQVTQRINGGQIGIADRRDWLLRVKALLGA